MSISATRLRRTALPTGSYCDPSTDEDAATTTNPTRVSKRLRSTKRPHTSPETHSAALQERPDRTVSHKRRIYVPVEVDLRYQSRARRRLPDGEQSEDSRELADDDSIDDGLEATSHTTTKRKVERHSQKGPLSKRTSMGECPFNSFKRRKTSSPGSSKGGNVKTTTTQVTSQRKIPPWQTLPYQILLRILQSAAYPLYRNASHDTGSTAWLLGISALSCSLHDAAISALLYSPPLFPAERAHALMQRLDAQQELLSTPYRNKIKRLHIEARELLTRKSAIDLIRLVNHTPLLKSLHIYHNYDLVGPVNWAQPSVSHGRTWTYPSELFHALDNNQIQLDDWTWNGRFPCTEVVVHRMLMTHKQECLKSLTSLSVFNLMAYQTICVENNDLARNKCIQAICALPSLQHLKIEQCTLLNGAMLVSFPSSLRSLSITECIGFDSSDFHSYLVRHGFHLEEISLMGNQALDLGFTPDLKTLCPCLRLFRMDLTYTDPTSFHDIEPHFEAVFPGGVMPTWPRTLQAISVENLRNLDINDAENFLKSLIDIASELTHLRNLSIRILLQDDGWRERAQLRQKWMPELEDVFLRKPTPPDPVVLIGRSAPATTTSNDTTGRSSRSSTATTNRKSSRLANNDHTHNPNTTTTSIPTLTPQPQPQQQQQQQPPPSPASPTPRRQKQGLCTHLTLHIDGQRPAPEQFNEADFLDDERSGDEEWNGRDVDFEADFGGGVKKGKAKGKKKAAKKKGGGGGRGVRK